MIQDIERSSVLNRSRLESELGVKINDAEYAEIEAVTPAELRSIVPYAAIWGIGDDGYRSDFVARAQPNARENLKEVVARHEDEFDAWLAGSEAAGPNFSKAYIAFTCMRMAADEV